MRRLAPLALPLLTALLVAAPAQALTTGALAGWGANGSGQLGDGATGGDRGAVQTTPVGVLGVDSAVGVAGGSAFALAVRGDGSVWTWGADDSGQLGDPTVTSGRSTPGQVPALTGAVAVAAGHTGAPDFALALLGDGTIRSWGSNADGELGNSSVPTGSGVTSASPVPVDGVASATAIAAGGRHALALLSDRTVVAWGSNASGQLGNASVATGSGAHSVEPVPVTGVHDVVAIAAGDAFSVALESDGSVWAWGDDTYGQQATGTTGSAPIAPHRVAALTAVRAIAAGGYHALALRADGTVAAWGDNAYGQLGDGSTTLRPAPVAVSGLSTVAPSSGLPAIAAARYSSYARRADGTEMAWGDDASGELGDGEPASYRASAAPVSALASVAAVAAGDRFALAAGPPPAAHVDGTVADASGHGLAGVAVRVAGTDSGGAAVDTTVTTGTGGAYDVPLAPGTYRVAPQGAPPAAAPGRYATTACAGTTEPGACTVTLTTGSTRSASFSYTPTVIVVDSTGDSASGACGGAPGACTLRAAIAAANAAGGAAIHFAIPGAGVPTIAISAPLPNLDAATLIDGATQPAGRVELRDVSDQLAEADPDSGQQRMRTGLALDGPPSAVRGMVVDGFPVGVRLAGGGRHVLEDDLIGTDPTGRRAPATLWTAHATGATWAEPDEGRAGVEPLGSETVDPAGVRVTSSGNRIGGTAPGQGDVISGNVNRGVVIKAPGNLLQGDTIGPAAVGGDAKRATRLASPDPQSTAFVLLAGPNTVGGGAANVVAGDAAVGGGAAGNVIAGNVFGDGATLTLDDAGSTVGGASAAEGNVFAAHGDADTAITIRGRGDVVEGNDIIGYRRSGVTIASGGGGATIGGDNVATGNRIDANALGASARATGGVVIGASSSNLIAHNELSSNGGRGAVVVLSGAGDTVSANRMLANPLGISLGGGAFRYNGLSAPRGGPNHLQPYPLLLAASRSARPTVAGRLLSAPRAAYRIEVYSQHGCALASVTPGQGAHPLAAATVRTDASGDAELRLTAARPLAGGDDALSATATAPDGSTSELSPCLPLGARAPAFAARGVFVTDKALTLSRRGVATLHPFCPPQTVGSCSGSLALTLSARGDRALATARLRVRLAPGELGSFRLRLPRAIVAKLRRDRRVRARVAIAARDGGGRPHRRRTRTSLPVVRAQTGASNAGATAPARA